MGNTPGNVVRGNQKLCKWILMVVAGYDLQIYKLSTNG